MTARATSERASIPLRIIDSLNLSRCEEDRRVVRSAFIDEAPAARPMARAVDGRLFGGSLSQLCRRERLTIG